MDLISSTDSLACLPVLCAKLHDQEYVLKQGALPGHWDVPVLGRQAKRMLHQILKTGEPTSE
jgi:hypothetical protein